MSGSSNSDSQSWSDSESETDIPIFFPVPFEELSSVQYYPLDEQLTELTAALKEQYQRMKAACAAEPACAHLTESSRYCGT
jgi:hypothetical protein